MKLTLIEKTPVASDVTSFVWRPEIPVQWQAGQYMHYVLPHLDMDERKDDRWFTISTAPFEQNLRITTRRAAEHGSSFKAALFALEPGATIEADGPEGDFVVADPAKSYVFIAGGIGITPIRSILAQLDHDQASINATLLYGNRNDEYVFGDELDAIASRQPSFNVVRITSPAHIDETAIQQAVAGKTDPLYYISGPEPMVKHYQDVLRSMGIADDRIKSDDFPGYEWEIKPAA